MSNNKKKSSQVIMKQDTSINWKKCEDKYIPAINTIIVYQDKGEDPKIKISDGVHTLRELPFLSTRNSSMRVEDDLLEFK